MKPNLYHHYMETAERISQLSYCSRLKTGAVVVTSTGSTFEGFNGTLPGFPNVCEKDDVTLPWTCHAEENSLYKMLKTGVSAEGSTLFCTNSPCVNCARMIISSGVAKVVYKHEYRDSTGISLIIQSKTTIEKYNSNYKE